MRSFALWILVCFSVPAWGQNPPDLPKAVSSFGAITCDGYVYIYGGHAGKSHSYDTTTVLGTFHRLSLNGGTAWEELPGGPILQGTNLASHGGKVYLVGGMQPRNAPGEKADNHSVADVRRYDPARKVWEPMPSLPTARSSHDVVVAGDTLVVVGGWQMTGKEGKTVWAANALTLDLSKPNAAWQSVPQPFERRALTAAALGQRVYVLGGLNGNAGSERTVDILDVSTGKWSKGPDLPGEDRVGFSPAATSVDGVLYVNTSEGPVYRLSTTGTAWEKIGTVEKTRIVQRLVPGQAGTLLVLGGAGKGGNVAQVERIVTTNVKP
jgi:N-acetylneuraminic acid mutarotase